MTWTIFSIILIGTLIPLPILFGSPTSIMVTRFVAISTIPLVSMIILNILIYKRLKTLQEAGTFGDTVNNAIFKAKMSMIITLTFILSQIVDWIAFGYWVSFLNITHWVREPKKPRHYLAYEKFQWGVLGYPLGY